jgi:hypothetical protein
MWESEYDDKMDLSQTTDRREWNRLLAYADAVLAVLTK